MQRAITIPEKEFEDLKRDIITEIHKFSKRRYGFKMVSRSNGKDITDDMQVQGMLSWPVEQVFKKHLGEPEDTNIESRLQAAEEHLKIVEKRHNDRVDAMTDADKAMKEARDRDHGSY